MKIFQRFLPVLSLLVLFSARPVQAQGRGGDVRVPPSYSSFLPPAAGGTYTDPAFSTTIKRISDATRMKDDGHGHGYVQQVAPEYSTMTPFNQDNTRLILEHLSYFGLYDADGRFIKNLPFEATVSSEPRWSRTDPDILYYHVGNRIKTLNTSTNATKAVHTFSEYSDIRGMGESDICSDGNHLVLVGDRHEVFVFDITTKKKHGVFDTKGEDFDQLYITPDDNVLIGWYGNRGVEMYDMEMHFIRKIAPILGHMDVTRDTNGDEIALWFNAADPKPICENGVVKIRLADASQTCVVKFDWSLAGHVSATDNSGWFFVETYAPENLPPQIPEWKTYTNEILQVKLDGSEVRRLAHHRSRPFDNYNYTPRVSASRDGSRIVFASNFGLKNIVTSALASGALEAILKSLGATLDTLQGYTNAVYTDAYLLKVDPATAGTALAASAIPLPFHMDRDVAATWRGCCTPGLTFSGG